MTNSEQNPSGHAGAASFARASAESRMYRIFDRAAERAIAEMQIEGSSMPQTSFTDDERQELRDAYIEWQALEAIFKKRATEFEFFAANRRIRTWRDEVAFKANEAKGQLWMYVLKGLFIVTTLVAALIVIFK